MRWTAPSALLVAAACAGSRPAAPFALSPTAVEEPVTAVINAALAADQRLDPADSLWSPDAAVIANGERRYAPPRFAGVSPEGDVAVTASRLEVRQSLVWVYLEYRSLAMKEGTLREGKATVLLTPRPGAAGWWIVHLHSSTAP